MTSKPFLEGTTIYMRDLRKEDVEGPYIHWLNDSEVNEHNSHHVFPYNLAQALHYIESVNGDEHNLVLAIIAKDTQKHIGNISLQNIDFINHSAEYAILLGDKDYWGKGVAKEASLLLIKHGFETLNLHRIYCGTSSKNIAMQKLAAIMGMSEEGRRKESQFTNGEYVDTIEYGILKESFSK